MFSRTPHLLNKPANPSRLRCLEGRNFPNGIEKKYNLAVKKSETWLSQIMQITILGLNRVYIRAQDLKISVPGTEFRCGAIGTRLVTQKVQKFMEIQESTKYRKSKTMRNHVFRLE